MRGKLCTYVMDFGKRHESFGKEINLHNGH